jgi:hypothetical protein
MWLDGGTLGDEKRSQCQPPTQSREKGCKTEYQASKASHLVRIS